MSSISEKSAFEAFARMEEKIDQNERQLRAAAEIDEEFTGDKLSAEFKQLERGAGGNDADSRLLALKQKMGVLPPPPPAASRALGRGATVPRRGAPTVATRRRRCRPRPQREDELLAEFRGARAGAACAVGRWTAA
jgi:phage shock protein A